MHRTNIAHPYPKRIYYTRDAALQNRQEAKAENERFLRVVYVRYVLYQAAVKGGTLAHNLYVCVCNTFLVNRWYSPRLFTAEKPLNLRPQRARMPSR